MVEEFLRIVNKSFIILRSGGIRRLLQSVHYFLFSQPEVYFYLYTKDLRDSILMPNLNTPKDLVVRQLAPSEMSRWRQGLAYEQEFFRYEIDNPDTCYAAILDGSLAHVSWVYSHSDGIIPLKAGEAEITYCFTLPKYRGKNIYPLVLNKVCEDLKSKGTSRVYLRILTNNIASIRGAEKAGFKGCFIVKLHRVLWMRKTQRFAVTPAKMGV